MALFALLVALQWIVAPSSFAENEDELDELKLRYGVAVEKLQQPLDELLQSYVARLEVIGKNYAAEGDLENALLAKRVRDAASANPPAAAASDPDRKLPTALGETVRIYATERAKRQFNIAKQTLTLDRTYHKELTELVRTLTIARKLDGASTTSKLAIEVGAKVAGADFREQLQSGLKLKGHFHSYIDDTASFYLNGKKFHSHNHYGNSVSPPVSIQLGDCLVFSARDTGNVKHFLSAFITEDGKHVLSLSRPHMKVLPDGSEARVISREGFDKLENRPVKQSETSSGGIKFPNTSDWMWEHGSSALLVAIVTEEMVTIVPPSEN